ncbi:MAG: 2'-5' RNA ligase family protein [Nanoarchaeota archaeon]|nr:2'-5' RNA ligase family protein [Nanoarchaeota archaeon]MBU1501772.1 2'-5' RNA ligase family protein [Nanoarchaeota archaeon]MBU2458882.1 2'-5' RNA ligase family protein [Nanoarchaeota archaeon]
MAYLVVAYPDISKRDLEWIQKYRKLNDPRFFSVIEPHITLVFSVNNLEKKIFVTEVKNRAKGFKKFDFGINVATINRDDSGTYYHEFLVPDKGYSNIVRLHDKLYSGKLNEHLRLDIDFIPHIGIGNSEDALTSKKRIEKINRQEVDIVGKVNTLDIIEYKNGKITPIEKIKLG